MDESGRNPSERLKSPAMRSDKGRSGFPSAHPMIAPVHSINMNRQAVPSILLSVSIVGFFAIALYQRDVDPQRSPELGGAAKAVPPGIGATHRAEALPQNGVRATPARESPRDRVAVAPPARVDGRGGGRAAGRAGDATAPAGEAASREPTPQSPAPPIRTVSTRPGRGAAQPSPPEVRADRARASGWRPAPAGGEASPSTARSENR
jgi:hypothetical protein